MSQTFTPETLPRVLTVRVTAEDIAAGVQKRSFECPIARALSRTYPVTADDYRSQRSQFWGVASKEAATYMETAIPIVYQMSKAAGEFVSAFDNHAPVAPATFRLRRAR